MGRSKLRSDRAVPAGLPEFAVRAAQKMGIDLSGLQGWALRPDGSTVLLAANGMKFVICPD